MRLGRKLPRAFAALLGLAVVVGQARAETPQERQARMAWYKEAKFGMFIHWGLYSIPAGTWNGKRIPGIGEWIMNYGRIPMRDYQALAAKFDPVKFDADAWVRAAKGAGMKYIVVTSKHHDGFAMFRSAASPFNIYDATPFHRDPLAELAAACRRQGMRLGFYYSQAQDWNHPGGAEAGGSWDPAQKGDMDRYIATVAVPQVREILTHYGTVSILWWDTPRDMNPQRAAPLAALLKLQPGIITNNRLGGGYPGDIETPEQRIPATGYPRDWESCMTMNDTWGYKSYDHNWKSAQTLVRNLVEVVSKGGNYLLNVGPTSEGLFPQPILDRLQAVGTWTSRYGEAIYGATASPFPQLTWGRATSKPGKVYLEVFDWPADGKLLVPMRSGIVRARLFGSADDLAYSRNQDGLVLQLPEKAPDPWASVVVLDIAEAVEALPAPPLQPAPDGSLVLGCDAGELGGKSVRVEGNLYADLTDWKTVDDSVTWKARLPAGRYQVVLDCQVPDGQGGSTYRVRVGRTMLQGTTAESGADYRKVNAGTIALGAGGIVAISVRPVALAHEQLFNLRTVTLRQIH